MPAVLCGFPVMLAAKRKQRGRIKFLPTDLSPLWLPNITNRLKHSLRHELKSHSASVS